MKDLKCWGIYLSPYISISRSSFSDKRPRSYRKIAGYGFFDSVNICTDYWGLFHSSSCLVDDWLLVEIVESIAEVVGHNDKVGDGQPLACKVFWTVPSFH